MRLLTVGLTLALLALSCADRKEEAEKMGQEVMKEDSTAVDTSAARAKMEADSIAAAQKAAADAQAALEESSALPPAPAGEGYTVQVAACQSYDYAQHLLDLYRRRGYEPYAVQFKYEGEMFYRVRIGSFATVAEAKALESELIDKYSTPAWIDWKSN